jgi:RNA-binding protein YhbY
LVSADAPKGVVLEECKILAEAETVVEETNAQRIEVAGKIFVLYKNLLSKDARSKWSTIVASQIGANP